MPGRQLLGERLLLDSSRNMLLCKFPWLHNSENMEKYFLKSNVCISWKVDEKIEKVKRRKIIVLPSETATINILLYFYL
jgi:hypothetical protein